MDGIIIINKEKEWTSNDVVQKVKHILKEKVGHTGTLDPLATGVLPLLIGKGTLLSKYLINHDKEYIATIKLGKQTDTADSEGTIIQERDIPKEIYKENRIQEILKSFEGEQKQIPPMYSAIKVNGKKLYEYARKGQNVEIKPREIEIYKMQLISFSENKNEIMYKVNCSKGTYIRRLCEDIAIKLGTVGFMKELQRTKVGDFSIEHAIKISEIEQFKNSFVSIEEFLRENKSIYLNDKQLKEFINGVKLHDNQQNGIYKIYNNSTFIGSGIIKNNELKRDIIII